MNTINDKRKDRLYELLPVVHRMRDVKQGEPLKALLSVISEQVNLLEDDISQLYENWFIETCEDWVVPYIGELVGYQPVHEAGEPSNASTLQAQLRNKILIPRREVANTIRYRRRKGTLALLELLAGDVAGWPARAVEFYKLLSQTQSINCLQQNRGRTVDVRDVNSLELLCSPFDVIAHNIDVRRINSKHSQARHNIPSVGVFICRLKSYSVTSSTAYCQEAAGPHCYTFSALGNDAPLFIKPQPEASPTDIAGELNLPVPIRRHLFEQQMNSLYGEDKSLRIWRVKKNQVDGEQTAELIPIPMENIIPADLSDWQYMPQANKVAVDPQLGRIIFPPRQLPKDGIRVSYHYGFSMDMGGGEYEREISQADNPQIYTVGTQGEFKKINKALEKWCADQPHHAVIEITDSNVYVEPVNVKFRKENQSLQIRAQNRQRPIIRLLDWLTDQPDALTVKGNEKSCFILDGITVTGRGMQISGDLSELTIRHSTLVPGWALDGNCEPLRNLEASIEINSPEVCVKIEHSITGAIQVDPVVDLEESQPEYGMSENGKSEKDTRTIHEEAQIARCEGIGHNTRLDPIRICVSDSIIDATDQRKEAIGAPGCPVAHACLTIVRSTVFGQIQVHAIELGENSIFNGRITVARRQKGCLRFSYITPQSHTPRRFRCQPDLVTAPIIEKYKNGVISESEKNIQLEQEKNRVRPIFNSIRYGNPTYCQLSECCAQQITQGADDEAEMGVFHDLFQPQQMANLTVRLDEYLPAKMDVGIIKIN